MPRFNVKEAPIKTVNKAGGEAFVESPKLAFVSLLLTSFVKDQFYRSADDAMAELSSLLDHVPPEFAAKAAVYARNEFGMRSITHVVAGEIAHRVHGEKWTRPFFTSVIRRPDDMMETVAYYLSKYKKPIPNALKDGLAKAFDKFDAYQLAKYRGDGHAISLVDVVNLTHPKPTEKNAQALQALVKDTLRSDDTWESMLTEAGQKGSEEGESKEELKKEAWVSLIREKKLGYFALLRNLRNIMEQAPEIVPVACEQLVNQEAIKRSLVLPFRFTTAIREIGETNLPNARQVLVALNEALDKATANVPVLEGSTLVALDGSGSMASKADKGGETPQSIGALFAAVLVKRSNADLLKFHERGWYLTVNPTDSTLSLARQIAKDGEPKGTNFHAIFQTANKKYDRIIILSDMQAWMAEKDGFLNTGGQPGTSFAAYKTKYEANPRVFSWDLQGLGSLAFPEPNVYALAGFSDKVFDLMKLLEQDRNALLKTIEAVTLR